MPRIITLLFCLILAHGASGQITLKQIWSPDGAGDGRAADHIIVDWVNGTYLGDLDPGVELRPVSLGLNVSLMKDFRFGSSNFSLGWGGMFSSHNVHSNARFVSVVDTVTSATFTNLAPWHSSYNYRKNKVAFNYLEMPIEFRLKTPNEVDGFERRPFRLSLGFKVGYLVNAHDKRIDDEGRFKNYNIEHILPYRYGVYARLGYGKFTLFGEYNLTTVFEPNRGVSINQISYGFSVAPF